MVMLAGLIYVMSKNILSMLAALDMMLLIIQGPCPVAMNMLISVIQDYVQGLYHGIMSYMGPWSVNMTISC